ncbi:MAG: GGDEF domain-containing protein, partial [Anaerolineales bacterium]
MSANSSLPTDDLTGLPTRKVFYELLDSVLQKARASETPVSLAFLDIDNFLHINDEYGHSVGDDVLKTIASLLTQYCGESAIPVRYGGDEFVVILPDVEREQAFLLLEKLRITVEETRLKVGKNGVEIDGLSISAGLACFPIDGHLNSELLRKADQALYRAKVTGRNKVRLAQDEKMIPKTSHYTQTQLERLTKLAAERQVGEAELLREAMD